MQPPGWHGKLPSLGDFAARRLDPAFIEVWDAWLAAGMLALRERDAEGWLASYLASPSWRFLLMPDALPGDAGTQGWAGVLMPSVDRVGRYFPLTLALPLGAGPCAASSMRDLWHWLGRLDELARDALYEDWGADRLEAELARMALPGLEADTASPVQTWPGSAAMELLELPALDAAAVIDGQAFRAWVGQARGSAWWQAVPDEGPRRLLISRGLPEPAELVRLFGPAADAAPSDIIEQGGSAQDIAAAPGAPPGAASGSGTTGETMPAEPPAAPQ